MFLTTIIMIILAVIFGATALLKGKPIFLSGVNSGIKLFLGILPMLFFAFILAGFIQALIPREAINRWIGKGSGLKGILVGCLAGSLIPGGPYTSFPIVAGLIKTGASIGTVVAFITAWSLWAFTRLPIEIGVVGFKLAFVRLASTFIFPPLAGIIAQTLFGRWF
ncbi:MAG: hypothetical protein A3G37_01095 [Omnitrophica WOR_2 bacterium RIFCSPLOWO2_12_FULL_46_30]|nr:MAG: hypothetical protein A3H41_03285 [Omnitrophica WOR_2 bacterium RIFCSPLOWO2_02_FULL_45_28]OGX51740.1 MAG: hypothetical protein A3G37_01095 [Omnitrophica WOR_2 bacterium RIFCSPLOWO2_12_FULL_46_30]